MRDPSATGLCERLEHRNRLPAGEQPAALFVNLVPGRAGYRLKGCLLRELWQCGFPPLERERERERRWLEIEKGFLRLDRQAFRFVRNETCVASTSTNLRVVDRTELKAILMIQTALRLPNLELELESWINYTWLKVCFLFTIEGSTMTQTGYS